MRNSNLLAALALSTLVLVAACEEDDPVQPPDSPGNTPSFLPLTTRDAVLNNLEVAWDNRASNKIDELLDDDFTFYFAPGDVASGLPADWSRVEELGATKALFVSNTAPDPSGPVCTSVQLDLALDEVTWDPIAPPASALGETWYTAAVHYDFTFRMEPDYTYISQIGAQALLTVREVAVEGGTEWRLVEWRDLPNGLVARVGQATASSEWTWGGIKGLYRNFLTLTTRNNVLRDLELAWDERSTSMIDQILDDDFTFFFAAGDVGGSIPEQWGRADELQTSHDLFVSNKQPLPAGPVCTWVQVDLSADNPQWVEIAPEDYPGEIWYITTVFYSGTFEMEGNMTYCTTPGAKAQFTVRDVGSGTPHYQLVEWRDLGASNVMGLAACQEATWGGIKALYH